MSPQIQYRDINLGEAKLAVIAKANAIARDYLAGGDTLTLRQLYYQFVSRGLIDNKDTEYKRLGGILNDARYAGLFDWTYITDRTRNVRGGDGGDEDPRDVVHDLSFYAALWEGQRERVEVWVEKDALVDVVGRAANPLRTPYFSCRGYTSASEVWAAAQRIEGYLDEPEVYHVTVLHLGDHDPSGIDMTRDITERLHLFLAGDGFDPDRLEVLRIALNRDQVDQYNPPPNPAKITDSRADGYIRRHGQSSWELDALEPAVLRALIQSYIRPLIDEPTWDARVQFERDAGATLAAFSSHYDEIHTSTRPVYSRSPTSPRTDRTAHPCDTFGALRSCGAPSTADPDRDPAVFRRLGTGHDASERRIFH